MIVADTNLLVYLLLPGHNTEVAERVLERDPDWITPLLWRSEFRNVLAHYLRRELLSRSDALNAFRLAEKAVHGREFAVETDQVIDLLLRSQCSAYDCEFVALALETRIQLVTSDRQVLKAFPEVAVAPDKFTSGSVRQR